MLSVFQIKGHIQKEIKLKSVGIKTGEVNSSGPTSCLTMVITKHFKWAQEVW